MQAYVVEGHHVGRVGDRHREPVVVLGHHDDAEALRDAAGQQPHRVRGEGELGEVGDLQAELVGQAVGDLALGREAEVDQDVPEPPSRADDRVLRVQRLGQLVGGHDPGVDEQVAEAETVRQGRAHLLSIGRRAEELQRWSGTVSPSAARRSSMSPMSSSSWRSSERRKSRVATSPTAIRKDASSRVR